MTGERAWVEDQEVSAVYGAASQAKDQTHRTTAASWRARRHFDDGASKRSNSLLLLQILWRPLQIRRYY